MKHIWNHQPEYIAGMNSLLHPWLGGNGTKPAFWSINMISLNSIPSIPLGFLLFRWLETHIKQYFTSYDFSWWCTIKENDNRTCLPTTIQIQVQLTPWLFTPKCKWNCRAEYQISVHKSWSRLCVWCVFCVEETNEVTKINLIFALMVNKRKGKKPMHRWKSKQTHGVKMVVGISLHLRINIWTCLKIDRSRSRNCYVNILIESKGIHWPDKSYASWVVLLQNPFPLESFCCQHDSGQFPPRKSFLVYYI